MFRFGAVALLLAGCATGRDDLPATAPLHSEKSAAAVSECIHAGWMEDDRGLPAAVRYPRGDGFTVTLRSPLGNTLLMADAVPDGDGSSVSIRNAFPWHDDLAESARGCV